LYEIFIAKFIVDTNNVDNSLFEAAAFQCHICWKVMKMFSQGIFCGRFKILQHPHLKIPPAFLVINFPTIPERVFGFWSFRTNRQDEHYFQDLI